MEDIKKLIELLEMKITMYEMQNMLAGLIAD